VAFSSPDLNRLATEYGGSMQQQLYQMKVDDIDVQSVIDDAI